MLCQPSSRRQTLKRRLARTRARGVNSCADSKQNHSCKPRRQSCRSLGKSRSQNNTSIATFSVRYPCTNQYSINALTDALGAIKERYAYDSYGGLSVFDGSGTARTSTAEANRYTYTGREWDEDVDLYHFRARMYDPVAGRFLSRDPIGYRDGMGLYRFLQSSPLNKADPSGMSFVCFGLGANAFGGAGFGPITLPGGLPGAGWGPIGIGFGVSGSCSWCVGYSRATGCTATTCCSVSVTMTPIVVGFWLGAGFGPIVTINPMPTPVQPAVGPGYSVGVGVGAGTGLGVVTPEVTVDFDPTSGDTTIGLPYIGFGVGTFVALRVNFSCTACGPGRMAQLRRCMTNAMVNLGNALNQLGNQNLPIGVPPSQVIIPGPGTEPPPNGILPALEDQQTVPLPIQFQ